MSSTLEESSRRRVRDALSALDVTFEDVPVVQTEWHVDADAYDRTRERHAAGTVGGAGTWTTRGDGAVLLVRDEPRGPWSEPGGKHERGESLVETAIRETREETGIDVNVHGVGFAQHVRVVDGSKASGAPIHRLIPVFEATPAVDPGSVDAGTDAVADARWFTERPDDLLYDALERLPFPEQE